MVARCHLARAISSNNNNNNNNNKLYFRDKTKTQVNYNIDDRMYLVTKVAIKRK